MLKESRERTEELVVRVRAEKNGRGSPEGRRRMVERVHELERAVVVLTRNRDEWREHSESTPGSFAEVERCREMVGRLERQVRVATRDALMARDASRRLTEEVLVLRRGRGRSGSERTGAREFGLAMKEGARHHRHHHCWRRWTKVQRRGCRCRRSLDD